MVEINDHGLAFFFPEIYPEARLEVSFNRTLRIQDIQDGNPNPPDLGPFPLEHVDDYARSFSKEMVDRGGVMMPMYKSEAMFISFRSKYLKKHEASYPFALQIAAGKINAVNGKPWSDKLSRQSQSYLVVPVQSCLYGYRIQDGLVRQFVAAPLGDGSSPEAQVTGQEKIGGIQISVYPMKRQAFQRRWLKFLGNMDCYSLKDGETMALSMGERINQEIYKDEFKFSEWETDTYSRCFVHLINAQAWKDITGKSPSTDPPGAEVYARHRLTWSELYAE
jgi:hypothetical protein